MNSFSIVHNEVNSNFRTSRRPVFIQVQDPTLNRNLGKYQVPHIWDHLLMASPNPAMQAFQHSNYLPPHLIHSLLVPSPPTTHTGGGIYFYGKYT